MVPSSAKKVGDSREQLASVEMVRCRSLMKMRNKRGLSTHPWGTPCWMAHPVGARRGVHTAVTAHASGGEEGADPQPSLACRPAAPSGFR